MNTAKIKLIPLPAPEEEITPLTVVADVDTVIAEAKAHAEQAAKHLRSSVEHALLAGLRIWWLHKETASQGARNDFVSRETKLGFEAALDQIGINRATAYRWRTAFRSTYIRFFGVGDVVEIPEPGTREFAALEQQLRAIAQQHTSLNRLMLGASTQHVSEELRYDNLIGSVESGNVEAAAILELVELGELSLEAAMKALGSVEATKGKPRREPVYFQTDFEGKLGGLFARSITTLKTGFVREFPKLHPGERSAVIKEWKNFLYEIKDVIEAVELEASQK